MVASFLEIYLDESSDLYLNWVRSMPSAHRGSPLNKKRGMVLPIPQRSGPVLFGGPDLPSPRSIFFLNPCANLLSLKEHT